MSLLLNNVIPLSIKDAMAISDLVRSTAQKFCHEDFTPEGWQRFLEGTSPQQIESRLQQPQFIFLGIKKDQILLGTLCIKENEKIDLLFVHEDFRGFGISSALWHNAKSLMLDGHPFSARKSPIWVRSSTYAIPIYEHWGFEATAERQEYKGISFTPMELNRV